MRTPGNVLPWWWHQHPGGWCWRSVRRQASACGNSYGKNYLLLLCFACFNLKEGCYFNGWAKKEKAPGSDEDRGLGQVGSSFFEKKLGAGEGLFCHHIIKFKPILSFTESFHFRYVLLCLLNRIACIVIFAMASTVTNGHLILKYSSFRKRTRNKYFF
jgi:hypothetical protein